MDPEPLFPHLGPSPGGRGKQSSTPTLAYDPHESLMNQKQIDSLFENDPELRAAISRLEYKTKAAQKINADSFVGRVFVQTTMYRTTSNCFAVVVDETDTTAFYKRIGRIVSSESETQNGIEYPDLVQSKNVLTLSRKECERGRKVINIDRDGEHRLSFRSRGETWRQWDGQGCYFDHLW